MAALEPAAPFNRRVKRLCLGRDVGRSGGGLAAEILAAVANANSDRGSGQRAATAQVEAREVCSARDASVVPVPTRRQTVQRGAVDMLVGHPGSRCHPGNRGQPAMASRSGRRRARASRPGPWTVHLHDRSESVSVEAPRKESPVQIKAWYLQTRVQVRVAHAQKRGPHLAQGRVLRRWQETIEPGSEIAGAIATRAGEGVHSSARVSASASVPSRRRSRRADGCRMPTRTSGRRREPGGREPRGRSGTGTGGATSPQSPAGRASGCRRRRPPTAVFFPAGPNAVAGAVAESMPSVGKLPVEHGARRRAGAGGRRPGTPSDGSARCGRVAASAGKRRIVHRAGCWRTSSRAGAERPPRRTGRAARETRERAARPAASVAGRAPSARSPAAAC